MPMSKTTTLVFSHFFAFIIAFFLGILTGYLQQKPTISALQEEKRQVMEQKEQAGKELNEARKEISELQYQLRLSGVLDQLTMLHLELVSNNYGKAASLSSMFFDSLRKVEAETRDSDLKLRFVETLKTRDEITAEIAKADPRVTAKVKWFLLDLHEGVSKYMK